MDAAVVAPRIGGLGVIIAIDVERGWVLGGGVGGGGGGEDGTPMMTEGVSVFV